jgi:hypothetical protein
MITSSGVRRYAKNKSRNAPEPRVRDSPVLTKPQWNLERETLLSLPAFYHVYVWRAQ